MSLSMIDESSWQSRAWTTAALKAAGVQVVAVKATEGTTYASPDYLWQVGQARAAGCAVIHYHLARYGDAPAEAAWFLDHADLRAGELVALDNEAQYIEIIPAGTASAWVFAWTGIVKGHSKAPAVIQYTSDDPIRGGWLESVRGQEPLWLAWPGANPASPPSPARAWLLSILQFGTRPGPVTTDVDCAYFGTLAQLRKLAIPAAPAPPPAAPHLVKVTATASFSDGTSKTWTVQ